jgi:transposase
MAIISGVERHRRWRLEDKLRIVAEAEAPGAVFALVARRHEVSRGQLWTWRTQVRSGALAAAQPVAAFIPVRVMPVAAGSLPRTQESVAPRRAPDLPPARPTVPPSAPGGSRIEIVLPDGICVRVDHQVGAAALRQVLAVLRG